jgi:hypothetical protein
VCLFRCKGASPEIPEIFPEFLDFPETPEKSPEYPGFTDKIVLSGDVNTKNWYREETDLWAEFGRRAPFDKRFSSKHSVKTSAVGSTPSFGRGAVSRLEGEAFGNA